MGYSGLIGETISLRGHHGDVLQAYMVVAPHLFAFFERTLQSAESREPALAAR